jgi:hypothetical protein
MRYAKHGLLNRWREGRSYFYVPNARTEVTIGYLEGVTRARDRVVSLMNSIGMMVVTKDYSNGMINAVLSAILPVRESIGQYLPEDAAYLVTIGNLLIRIQKGNSDASDWKSLAIDSERELGKQVAKNKEEGDSSVTMNMCLIYYISQLWQKYPWLRTAQPVQFGSLGQGVTTADPVFKELWKQFEEELKADGERLMRQALKEESEEKARPRMISRSKHVAHPVFRAGDVIRDSKGDPVYASFIIVEDSKPESLEIAKRFWAERKRQGLVIPKEAAGIIPLLTNGPFAEILNELCDVEMKVDDLSEGNRAKFYELILERTAAVNEMLAQVNRIIEKASIPMLSDFLEKISKNR